MKISILVCDFNRIMNDNLLSGARHFFHSIPDTAPELQVHRVPGAYELPQAASWCARQLQPSGVVALGVVIRGETPHFDYICSAAAQGLNQVGLDTGVPISFGVITADTWEQAQARSSLEAMQSSGVFKFSGAHLSNKGYEAAAALWQMIGLRRRLDAADDE